MPLLRVKRHMRTISSVHSDKVWPSVTGRREAAGFERGDQFKQLRDVLTARGLALGFQAQQPTEFFFEFVDGGARPAAGRRVGRAAPVAGGRAAPWRVRSRASQPRFQARAGQSWRASFEQMLQDQPHGMEAIGDDQGVGKPSAGINARYEGGQVDADDTDLVAAVQSMQEGPQFASLRPGVRSKTRWFFRSQNVVAKRWWRCSVCSSRPSTCGQSRLRRSFALRSVNWA